jgi:hypothetical protein
MFRYKQSSVALGVANTPSVSFCGQVLPNAWAARGAAQDACVRGGRHRKSPTGAAA